MHLILDARFCVSFNRGLELFVGFFLKLEKENYKKSKAKAKKGRGEAKTEMWAA